MKKTIISALLLLSSSILAEGFSLGDRVHCDLNQTYRYIGIIQKAYSVDDNPVFDIAIERVTTAGSKRGTRIIVKNDLEVGRLQQSSCINLNPTLGSNQDSNNIADSTREVPNMEDRSQSRETFRSPAVDSEN